MQNLDQFHFHPVFKFQVEKILGELEAMGWRPKIASAKRTTAEQAEKLKKGYSKTMHSWHVESTRSILPEGKSAYSVVLGNAADVVDKRYGWGGPAANKEFGFWKDLGKTAKKHGCFWGGDWKMRDVAHIQLLFIDSAPQTTIVA
jgi:hypothetical protein